MADGTSIEWTDATWNCLRGCSLVSQGCRSCYAMRQAHRFSGKGGPYEGLTKMTSHGPTWTGKVRTVPELLDQPLRWKKPRRIFVNSMSDLFHEDVPATFVAQVFAVMSMAPQHTFQVLTKRPERMLELMTRAPEMPRDALPNVWLGVSVEDQATADERIPLLLQTPAAVRWISAEPLLGPIDLDDMVVPDGGPGENHMSALDCDVAVEDDEEYHGVTLDWVVVGGESGPKARDFDIGWARAIVAQCRVAQVPVLVKQLGAKPVWSNNEDDDSEPPHCGRINLFDRKGGTMSEWPEDLRVREYPA